MKFKGVNFDQLVDWAENDPNRLEAFRRKEVNKLIEQASPASKRRLRGLQFQIESQCRLHGSAIGRCVQISKMMHDSLHELGAAINGSRLVKKKAAEMNPTEAVSATVLSFPGKD